MHTKHFGFTLIETLAVSAIILILVIVAVGTLSTFRKVIVLDSATEDGISLLHEARTKTLASEGASQYGVHFETNKIVLFKGPVYSAGSPDNIETILPTDVAVSTISLNGGGNDVVFKRLVGETDNYGYITLHLVSDPLQIRTIHVLVSGIETITPTISCEWGVFSQENITLAGSAFVNSYNSNGGGASNQASVQTNSITNNAVMLANNATIQGSITVGPGGDPNSVISLGSNASISGPKSTAAEAVVLPPAPSPIQPPPPHDPLPTINPPPTSGSSYILGGNQTGTINICTTPVSSINVGTNASLTITGDCPLHVESLSIGGSSQLTVTGNIGELRAGSFSIGTNVPVIFSSTNPLLVAANTFSVGGSSSLAIGGSLAATTNSFTLGTNVPATISGDMSLVTNTFSLAGSSSLTIDGKLSATAQTYSLGTNVAVTTDGPIAITTNSFSLAGSSSITTPNNFDVTTQSFALGTNVVANVQGNADILTNSFSMAGSSVFTTTNGFELDTGTFFMGTNVAISTDTTNRIRTNTFTMADSSSIKSTTLKPVNTQITVTGTSASLGTNTSLTGVLYAPAADITISGNGNISGSVIGKSLALGTNAGVSHDLAILGAGCIQL